MNWVLKNRRMTGRSSGVSKLKHGSGKTECGGVIRIENLVHEETGYGLELKLH